MTMRRIRAGFFVVAGLWALGYFSYHAITGDHGLIAWNQLRAELAGYELEHATLVAYRTDVARSLTKNP